MICFVHVCMYRLLRRKILIGTCRIHSGENCWPLVRQLDPLSSDCCPIETRNILEWVLHSEPSPAITRTLRWFTADFLRLTSLFNGKWVINQSLSVNVVHRIQARYNFKQILYSEIADFLTRLTFVRVLQSDWRPSVRSRSHRYIGSLCLKFWWRCIEWK